MKTLQKITVLFNKTLDQNYSADVDTANTAKEISEVLEKKYSIELLGITPEEIFKIKNIKSDLVFNLLEWTGNYYVHEKDALKELQKNNIPFTGSDIEGYEMSGNKMLMKKIFVKNNIPTPMYQIFETGQEEVNNNLKYPVIIKPALEHCGLGVSQASVCRSDKELRTKVEEFIEKFKQPILAEEFIDGRELHVTVLEKNGQPWVLPPTEVVFKKEKNFLPILSYEGKWDENSEEYSKSWTALADLSDKLLAKVNSIAKKTYLKLGGLDYPRLDMRIRADEVYVLEINNNPGIDFTTESGFGVSGRAAGFDYLGILSHIVENAYLRFVKGAYDTARI